jgi:choline dehydrogenase-like flavoprotein
MIEDARSLPNDATLRADVCIVGAGVAGMSLALEFIKQPLRVCLLESGALEPTSAAQELALGESIGQPYFQLDDGRPRCLGGSSYNWVLPVADGRIGIQGRPLDPIDFEERSWVPYSGWPFDRDHLAPFYRRAQPICGVRPDLGEEKDGNEDAGQEHLPFAGDTVKSVRYQLFPARDMFLDQHRREIAAAPNVTVFLNATVLEVETTTAGDNVERLLVATDDQKRVRAVAKTYVLALGGIETPRLLLLSRGRHPSGLGNGNDLVGRFFQEHPHMISGTCVTVSPSVTRTTGGYALHTVAAARRGSAYARLTLSEEVMRRESLLNWTVGIERPIFPTSVRVGLMKALSLCRMMGASLVRGELRECRRHARSLGPFLMNDWTPAITRSIAGRMHRLLVEKLMLSRRGTSFSLHHMAEQTPNPSSRVTLSERRDRFGQERVQLNWQLSPRDIDSMVRSQEILDGELRAAGLGRVEIDMKAGEVPKGLHGGWHHMGTTRMHRQARLGVVDENCRVHGVANLYVAGPSTFPTSGCANPALTIVALALRLADHIKNELASL